MQQQDQLPLRNKPLPRSLMPDDENIASLEALLTSAPVGIAYLDKNLRYVKVNDMFTKMSHRPPGFHMGRTVRETHPNAADFMEPILQKVLKTGEPIKGLEVSRPNPDKGNEPQHFSGTYFPIISNSGETIGVGGIISDITALKESQNYNKRLARELELVSNVVSVHLSHYDREERIISVNKVLLDFWKIPEKEIVGKTILQAIGEEQYSKIKDTVKKVLRGESVTFEENLTNPEGLTCTFLITYIPEKDAQGNVTGFICSGTNITELKHAREEIKRKAQLLENANLELDRFAAIAAHDLKSPIMSITQFTELFADLYRGRIDDKADNYIQYIVNAGDRMLKLIDNLLEYARAGTLDKSKFENINISDCIKNAQDHLLSDIVSTKAKITANQNLPTVFGHKLQIIQLFQNLIANAIKFHKPAQTPKIHIDFTEEENFWKFSVHDEGIGIADFHKEKIFEAFIKLHNRTQYEGSGLGLAVCKRIVEGHEGTISVASEPNVGTTFYFTLPKAHFAHT